MLAASYLDGAAHLFDVYNTLLHLCMMQNKKAYGWVGPRARLDTGEEVKLLALQGV
jgi:hypothetical protein